MGTQHNSNMDPEIEPTEPEKTPYEWLDVAKNADANTIRHAYTKLVLQHHPDRGGDKDVFDSINQAHQVLTDPRKRRIFDKMEVQASICLPRSSCSAHSPAGWAQAKNRFPPSRVRWVRALTLWRRRTLSFRIK